MGCWLFDLWIVCYELLCVLGVILSLDYLLF